MESKAGSKTAYLKYIISVLLFGTNGIAASMIDLSSVEVVFFRSTIGAALLTAIFFLKGNKFRLGEHRRDAACIIASGVSMAAGWMLLFEAYDHIGVSLSVLINYTGPAIVIALAPILFKEKLTKVKVLAFLCAAAGVFLITGEVLSDGLTAWGLTCAILSAFCYAATVSLNKLSVNITGLRNATLQLLVCAACVAVFLLLKQGPHIAVTASDIIPILWLGLLNTGIGCYLYFSSLNKLSAQTIAIWGYIEPMSAVVLSAFILHETMSGLQWAGAVLIIGSAVMGELLPGGPGERDLKRQKSDT